jgi:protein TonB
LHSAIQKVQIYPETALSMQRSGRVTVSFDLSPDGNIANLKLVKSSNTLSLDNAALDAIRHASPFQGINKYLRAVKNFQIDLTFEMPKEAE